MLIDTHCHLDAAEFADDRAHVLEAAQAAGVGCLIVPAVARANFAAVTATCHQFPICQPAYGIHPLYVGQAKDADLDALRLTLQRESAVALGEIGLDYFVAPRDEQKQTAWFIEQLQLAQECDLPVLLHVRKAIDATLKALRRTPVAGGGIAHAFNGSRQQADAFIQLGFKLGFGGAMTYPKATRLRELAATLPLASIVLETDAPDMSPAWCRGRRNEPAELRGIAETLATLRGQPVEEIIAATTANARAALPRLARRGVLAGNDDMVDIRA